ncbi:hypothetical protein [Caballeronia sp. LZ043]|uniref:hypothetical protein n=1 Tax=Caballeronia sp. LZ043 TaxID=3038569 RepID=UPI0028581273|nr:hypothetical protein [Caballeronia sp. LZ043]MDR5824738.1 hypothetical protein [Caballeronia sp. LZ043]
MNDETIYTELVGSTISIDIETEQLLVQFDMSVNGQIRSGRPWRISQEGAERLIFQLRHSLDLLRQSGERSQ